ncbi:Fructosamine kinase-domain-containing protein [Halenospora varia]|nr:Fructosamine kinase-domain-containing protein [Halenospora varia]
MPPMTMGGQELLHEGRLRWPRQSSPPRQFWVNRFDTPYRPHLCPQTPHLRLFPLPSQHALLHLPLPHPLPSPSSFCAQLASLHTRSQSPNGKFGFHVTTYNGDLPQDNKWVDTWEECFVHGLKQMLNPSLEGGGPWEMEDCKRDMVEKVIPRLLRPLESGGRRVKSVLAHGDSWCGNAVVGIETGRWLIFDPSSFHAHNECELGNWRPKRNKFGSEYFEKYHEYVPKSEPVEDWDDRNALYAL